MQNNKYQLQIVDSGVESAAVNMALDERLLADLASHPILHFYEWRDPSATYGYFVKPEQWLISTKGIDLARRPTGGGLLFHTSDWAFSLLMPSSHPSFDKRVGAFTENYIFVNRLVVTAMRRLFPGHYTFLESSEEIFRGGNCCMTWGAKYDVLIDGKKAVGAAQRTKKQGYLHQGTISLGIDPDFLRRYLPDEVVERMRAFTYAPLGVDYTPDQLASVKHQLKQEMQNVFCEALLS